MSNTKFTLSHGLLSAFLEMSNVDGTIDKIELNKIGEVSRKYITALGDDFDQVVSETFNWFVDAEQENRMNNVLNSVRQFKDFFDKKTLIFIAKDLVRVAQSDGDIHDREAKLFGVCLDFMGLTREDLE